MPVNNSEDESEVRERQRPFKISVELPCLLILFGGSLSNGVTSNLLLYRACINDLGYNSSECDLLLEKNKTAAAKELETVVESDVTLLLMTLSVFSGVVPAVLSLFLGGWSDKHGRKPLCIVPVLGLCITSILNTVYCAIPSLGAWWFLPSMLPFSLFGGFTSLILGANLLVTDLTTDKNRSLRLSILQGCCFVGVLIGTVSSSYVYEAIGYTYMFMLIGSLNFIALLYLLLLVKEPLQPVDEPSLRDLFNSDSIRTLRDVCTKRRPPSVAITLALLITASGLSVMCVNGVLTVEYLFTRNKFDWLLRDYTIFNGATMSCMVFGMIFGMAFFQKCCHMRDGVLLVLAYLSSISDSFLRGFAQYPWHMYVAASTSILGGLSSPLIKSRVSKTVPSEEVGKLFSLMSCVEAMMPVFAPTLFSTIYYKTLTTFPGTIYLTAAGFYIICLIFAITAEILTYRAEGTSYGTLIDESSIQDVD